MFLITKFDFSSNTVHTVGWWGIFTFTFTSWRELIWVRHKYPTPHTQHSPSQCVFVSWENGRVHFYPSPFFSRSGLHHRKVSTEQKLRHIVWYISQSIDSQSLYQTRCGFLGRASPAQSHRTIILLSCLEFHQLSEV